MSCTLSDGGAGQPYVWYSTPSPFSAAYFGSLLRTGWSCSFAYTGRLKASPDMMYSSYVSFLPSRYLIHSLDASIFLLKFQIPLWRGVSVSEREDGPPRMGWWLITSDVPS